MILSSNSSFSFSFSRIWFSNSTIALSLSLCEMKTIYNPISSSLYQIIPTGECRAIDPRITRASWRIMSLFLSAGSVFVSSGRLLLLCSPQIHLGSPQQNKIMSNLKIMYYLCYLEHSVPFHVKGKDTVNFRNNTKCTINSQCNLIFMCWVNIFI